MTQNSRKVKKVAASSKITNGKRMPKRVEAASYTANPITPAYDFEITKDIPLHELAALLGAKDDFVLMAGEIAVEDLAKLNAHWYESLFFAFSVDKQCQSLKVHILAREAQQLVYPHTSIKRGKRKGFHAIFTKPDGLPVYKPIDLLRAESG